MACRVSNGLVWRSIFLQFSDLKRQLWGRYHGFQIKDGRQWELEENNIAKDWDPGNSA